MARKIFLSFRGPNLFVIKLEYPPSERAPKVSFTDTIYVITRRKLTSWQVLEAFAAKRKIVLDKDSESFGPHGGTVTYTVKGRSYSIEVTREPSSGNHLVMATL